MSNKNLIIRKLGVIPYQVILSSMHKFIKCRTIYTCDELWFLEHHCVFTQGKSSKPEHILKNENIPIVQSDRGGKTTYHGPGQQIIYVMLDIKRLGINIKELMNILENVIIETLKYFSIESHLISNAPGVYINGEKICSVGLRVRHGYTFHGIALNINMDLNPFNYIIPCGFNKLKMTQLSLFKPKILLSDVYPILIKYFYKKLSFYFCYDKKILLNFIF
ncbi:lipoyl(octanoyl) transferase LipB [Candidatus Providencia siddallii]|uniref:Octanoyltransferase n=1 Tax=Candidatus Providencia siddallii TaxID=1715285 RepID=A0ABM9NNG4_9GAMM